jgi:hypothetical protein
LRTTTADTRAETLTLLDALEDDAARLGLCWAAGRDVEPVLLAEVHAGVKDCADRLRSLLARSP